MEKDRQYILNDIKENPQNHIHHYDDLIECCTIDGSLDGSLLEAHSQYIDLGKNGGQRCDVLKGPCACGAWH